MKTLSSLNTIKILFSLALMLISFNGFSQRISNHQLPTQNKSKLTTLQNVVDGIKEKNESIKNVEQINVMVNDLIIKNPEAFAIDPKSITMVEVVDLDLKPRSSARIKPSIIINTK